MKKVLIFAILLTGYFVNAQDIGGDYYVSVYGDDNNPGTYERPWATFQKAFDEARPGDTVYFRGGVYFSTYPNEIRPTDQPGIGRSGTAENPICYFNYPSENPILDCILHCDTEYPYGDLYNSAIGLYEAEHIHFKGLTIRNVFQCDPVVSAGIGAISCANLTFENITMYNISQRGYWYDSGAYGTHAPNPVFEYDTVRWINCDTYNLCDSLTDGRNADAWKTIHYGNNYVLYQGCRAWNYSDDGFDCNNIDGAIMVYDSCWAMSTDKYQDYLSSLGTEMEGNGFKFSAPQYNNGNKIQLYITNCIASHCVGYGFYNNLYLGSEGHWANNARVYNNTAHKCYLGFYDKGGGNYPDSCTSVYRNNIAWDATSSQAPFDPLYEVFMAYTTVAESHNTWDVVEFDWPGWVYTDTVTISNNDFVSLDETQLTRPRKYGIHLPDITYLNLAAGSDMIDAGKFVGLPYVGSAPDIGAFEFGATPGSTNKYPSIVIISPESGSTFYEPNNDIDIIADALDTDGSISKVEFYSSTTKIGEKTSYPWSFRWRDVPVGSYTLWARATDNQSASARSANVYVTVEPQSENRSPNIVITYPANGSKFYETNNDITIIADASDPDGSVTKVEFFQGSTKLGEKTSSPWSYRWNNVPVGSYSIWARAHDNRQATANSQTVSVSVEAVTSNQPPYIAITSPTNGTKYIEPNTDFTITANANDPDGSIVKVEFFQGNTKLGEKASPPWSYRWNDPPVGNYSIWARAHDNDGASANSPPVSVIVEPEEDDTDNENNISNLYPNPNNGSFDFLLGAPLEDSCKISIVSLSGIEVYHDILLPLITSKRLELPYIQPGLYILLLYCNDLRLSRRFVKY
ncbi:MAG: hypothetical protein JW965_00655 [Bacteroidales bacterium]|nr:hypothetical protein [Bacteroidales bacterium]